MASGRVGGTRSKITGQVGNTIYQVRRNDDGSYTQITMQKGVATKTTTTPKLQAQRMCTAMVESLMRDLKEVGRISMQSGVNKSKSLNAFSSMNLMLLLQDCKANWYSGNQFIYPTRSAEKLYVNDLGGNYLISAGTLQGNLFDRLYYEPKAYRVLNGISKTGNQFFGLELNVQLNVDTIESFMLRHRMTRLDSIVFCAFRHWLEYNIEEDELQEKTQHSWVICKINPSMPSETILDESAIARMFVTNSNHSVLVTTLKTGKAICIGFQTDLQDLDEDIYYWAGFSISYLEGKKRISNSTYKSIASGGGNWLLNAAPTDVFATWIGAPFWEKQPSPWE